MKKSSLITLASVGSLVLLGMPLLYTGRASGQAQNVRPIKKQIQLRVQQQKGQKSLLRVSTQDNGIVQSVAAKSGQQVQKGDILLRLDDKLAKLEVVRRQRMVEEAKYKLKSSEATVAEAKAQYERAARLHQIDASMEGPASKKFLMQRPKSDALAQTAAVSIRDTDLAVAKILLQRLTIRAPADGVVQRVLYRPGEAVWALGTVVLIRTKE